MEVRSKNCIDYYPFGLTFNSYTKPGTVNQNWKFQGQEEQRELGTYSYLFREYDPALGRWWQLDPLYKFHESQYAYVTNNPITYLDLLGLDTLNSTDKGFNWDKVKPGDFVDGAAVLNEVTTSANRIKRGGFQTIFLGSEGPYHNGDNEFDPSKQTLVIDMDFFDWLNILLSRPTIKFKRDNKKDLADERNKGKRENLIDPIDPTTDGFEAFEKAQNDNNTSEVGVRAANYPFDPGEISMPDGADSQGSNILNSNDSLRERRYYQDGVKIQTDTFRIK